MTEIKLTEYQEKVRQAALNAENGDIIVLRGFAGTGKSVTASEIIKSFDTRTLVLAPTAAALSVLKAKLADSGADFRTLASLMTRHQSVVKFGDAKTFYPVIASNNEDDKYMQMLKATATNPIQSVYDVIDEVAKFYPTIPKDEIVSCFDVVAYHNKETYHLKSNDEFLSFFEQSNLVKYDPAVVMLSSFRYGLNLDLIIDEDKLNKLTLKAYNGMNVFGKVETDSKFDFVAESAVSSTLEKYELIVVDEMSMMSKEYADFYCRAFDSMTEESNLKKFLGDFEYMFVVNDEERISTIKESDEFKSFLESESSRRTYPNRVTLVVGDPGQLKPVSGEFNDWCSLEADDDKIFELKDVLRSTDEIAMIGSQLRSNIGIDFLASRREDFKVYPKGSSLREVFDSNLDLFKDSDIALAFTNKDVNFLNDNIRLAKGLVGHVQSGDKLVVNKNIINRSQLRHANGSIYTVEDDLTDEFAKYIESVSNKGIKITAKSEKDMLDALNSKKLSFITFIDGDGNIGSAFVDSDLDNLYDKRSKDLYSYINKSLANESSMTPGLHTALKAFSSEKGLLDAEIFMLDAKFAHAMTVHKSQGSQFDNVVYVTSSRDQWIQSQDLGNSKYKQAPAYVAVTRAKKKVTVIYIK